KSSTPLSSWPLSPEGRGEKAQGSVLARFELALDVARDQIDREQVADVAHLGVLLELLQVGEGHPGLQLRQPLLGHTAVLHELRIALKNRLGEQLAARDLDPELPLQAEDDVEEVD